MAAFELYNTPLFLDSNLQHYYRMEGNSNDSKGSLNGSDTSVSYSTGAGKFNKGAAFGGSSQISLGSTYDLTGKSWSVGAWAKINDVRDEKIMQITASNATDRWINIRFTSGGTNSISIDFFNDDLSDATNHNDTTNFHLVVATFNFSTKQRTIYFDGNQTAQDTSLGTPNVTGANILIGASMNGDIDDWFLFDRVLTATEVNRLYTGNIGTRYGGFISNLL